ncbi:MAG: phospholipase [Anaerolineae bacterium]|nr:phospholipase [Gemmatimonadaceae bacterium]
MATGDGRLRARPSAPTIAIEPGVHALGLGSTRDGLLYVPAGYSATQQSPLVILLHGAGGNAAGFLDRFRTLLDTTGVIALVPDSRMFSWDLRFGAFGPDVAFIDTALEHTFRRCSVDPLRISMAGFSDGASYALSLGVTNGDWLKKLVAFSPGYLVANDRYGNPPVFITHGTRDTVLPIANTRQRIVPELERLGHTVIFREFDGPHTIPADLAGEALQWLTLP